VLLRAEPIDELACALVMHVGLVEDASENVRVEATSAIVKSVCGPRTASSGLPVHDADHGPLRAPRQLRPSRPRRPPDFCPPSFASRYADLLLRGGRRVLDQPATVDISIRNIALDVLLQAMAQGPDREALGLLNENGMIRFVGSTAASGGYR